MILIVTKHCLSVDFSRQSLCPNKQKNNNFFSTVLSVIYDYQKLDRNARLDISRAHSLIYTFFL